MPRRKDHSGGQNVDTIERDDEFRDPSDPSELPDPPPPEPGDKLRLVALSFLMLFVEIALIRWTGSNVVYLSYFSNFVLLGSFLGIGVGFLRGRARVSLWPWAPVALALLVFFVFVFPVEIDRTGGELIYFGSFSKTGLPTWVTLPAIFFVVAATLAMLAEGVARTFARFPPLEAYRWDILGSILGIVAFTLLSFLRSPPIGWGIVAAALFVYLYGRRLTWAQGTALVLILLMLGIESLAAFDSWSPYYKVTLEPGNAGTYGIAVNGIPHQAVQSTEIRRQFEPIYFKPYEQAADNPLGNVLVVGAGNGTDVAIALEQGADHVDAVEIDPRLYEIGKDLHPDRPYHDDRVDVHVDDGRAFLERTDTRYDLILFALPDSLTLVSGQSSLRLESYLFTVEAMEEARDHLAPGGVFAMYNFYREQWLVDRLVRTLAEVYDRPPCIETLSGFGGLALLTATLDPSAVRCTTIATVSAEAPEPVHDDYPFLYLRQRAIPSFYFLTIALILLFSLLVIRGMGGPFAKMSNYMDLFFMGAAFLLLETKNVVQFALLFGTTWVVNALVFTGILLSVYAAVELARRVQFDRPVRLYYVLLAALAIAWAVPSSALLNLPLAPRFVSAVLLAFMPIFLANLVFAERFKDVGSSTTAFGANLLGAMVGGILEYSALIVGYRSLLIVTAVLYGLAFVFGRRHLAQGASAGAAA